MRVLKKVYLYITNPSFRFNIDARRGKYDNLSDEEFLKLKFKTVFGREMNLINPKSYNEKLQWIKLYDRKPVYSNMVDKYEAKKYVTAQIGDEYVIPTLGVWERFEDIDFEKLPDKFVLKCTHDSGGLIICRDKRTFDMKHAKIKIERCLKYNYFLSGREWPYKNIKPRIIAEEYMEDTATEELRDYKFYTFNGKAKYVMVNSERGRGTTKADYFDMDFNWLDFTWGYPNSDMKIEKPRNFEKMIELSECLAKDTYELRVDFYECNGKILFGELTFFDGGGFTKFQPESWDFVFGSELKLPFEIKDLK